MRPSLAFTTGDKDVGRLDLLIKVYKAGVHPAYPEGGKMSQVGGCRGPWAASVWSMVHLHP